MTSSAGGDFHAYLANKIKRQREQFGQATSDISTISVLFRNCHFLINGHTEPDNLTLTRMIHAHGGNVETYETSLVTHVIASRLSVAKKRAYESVKKRVKFVIKPDWVVECIRVGHRVDEVNYSLLEQLGGSIGHFINRKELSHKKKKVTFQEVENESTSSVARQKPRGDVIRTTGTDPNFLESYFATSRLSFIGSYQQRMQSSNANSPPKKQSKRSEKLTSVEYTSLVMHVDIDSFFCAVVLRKYPQYKDKPVAIAHASDDKSKAERKSTSEVSTCNYIAREFGVGKGMWLGEARRLCSNLVVLPYDYEGYEEVSRQVFDILCEYGVVEMVSCDEAYLAVKVVSEDQHSCKIRAIEIGEKIRSKIEAQTQCTVSVGIGLNKLLAKLGTNECKPDGLYYVDDFKPLLKEMHLSEIPGIGYKTNRKLIEAGMQTVQDIWDIETSEALSLLQSVLGPNKGKKVLDFCSGIDNRKVESEYKRKTIGAECNYGVRFDGPYGVDHMINGLANEVERRMKSISMKGKKLTLKVLQRHPNADEPSKFLGHGWCNSFSKSISLNSLTHDSTSMAEAAAKLYRQLDVEKNDIRGMGIVMSDLREDNAPAHEASHAFLSSWLKPVDTSSELKLKFGCGEQPASALASEQQKRKQSEIRQVDEPEIKASILIRKAFLQLNSDEAYVSPVEKEINCALSSSLHSQISDEDDDACTRGQGNSIQSDADLNEESFLQDVFVSSNTAINEVPTYSQIDQNVLEALPVEIRREIESVVPKPYKSTIKKSTSKRRVVKRKASPVRRDKYQRDLKQMMKLANVKSGNQQISPIQGEQISLTYLDSLPMNLQLDIVNNDGRVNLPETQNINETTESSDVPGITDTSQTENNVCVCEVESADLARNEEIFYQEDLLPLHNWLDEHNSEDNIIEVNTFISLCLEENRVDDVIKLLRSIKRRDDCWGDEKYFSQILDSFEKKMQERNPVPVDLSWLGLQ